MVRTVVNGVVNAPKALVHNPYKKEKKGEAKPSEKPSEPLGEANWGNRWGQTAPDNDRSSRRNIVSVSPDTNTVMDQVGGHVYYEEKIMPHPSNPFFHYPTQNPSSSEDTDSENSEEDELEVPVKSSIRRISVSPSTKKKKRVTIQSPAHDTDSESEDECVPVKRVSTKKKKKKRVTPTHDTDSEYEDERVPVKRKKKKRRITIPAPTPIKKSKKSQPRATAPNPPRTPITATITFADDDFVAGIVKRVSENIGDLMIKYYATQSQSSQSSNN
jgi:hypothetical protein